MRPSAASSEKAKAKAKTKVKTKGKIKIKIKRKPRTKKTTQTSTVTSTSQQAVTSASSVADAGIRNTPLVMDILQDPETIQAPPQLPTDEKLPLAPANESPTVKVPTLETPLNRSAFTILWAKKNTRKPRVWEGDGILEVKGECGVVKDVQGTRIGQINHLITELIVPGLILSAGKVEIQIKELIPIGSKQVISMQRVYTEPPQSARRTLAEDPSGHQKGAVKLLVMPKPSKEHARVYNTKNARVIDVTVSYCLAKVLRPHQRLGVVFLYECVTGIRQVNRCGAILADETGMGKSLQCVTLIWTLLLQGPYGGTPIIKKALIIAPSGVTATWEKEFYRWLGRNRIRVFAAHSRKQSTFSTATHPVFIISYEMFVRHFEELSKLSFDLIICDEGNRLSNAFNKTPTLLNKLPCTRRIILTSTPVQNDLQEFFSLVDFVNPGCVGTSLEYLKNFAEPILASREPNVSEDIKILGENRMKQLNDITTSFIMRRTQEISGAYIPTKTETVVFCKSSPLQQRLYAATVKSWNKRDPVKDTNHQSVITILRKICNHPSLIVRDLTGSYGKFPGSLTSVMSTASGIKLEESGKVKVLLSLLRCVEANEEKIVIVSSYTQTLGMLANLCEVKDYKYVRLDGSVPAGNRTGIVACFNSPWSKILVFLLSAKAGGVALDLSGASRLVLFDTDWNPTIDLQAMARIWRDGQKFSAYIYRFITTGTLEEKIFQRQISKTGLSGAVVDPASTSTIRLSDEELKDLFKFKFNDGCMTHSLLNCKCKCDGSVPECIEVKEEPDRDEQLDSSKVNQASKLNELMIWEHHKPPFNGANIDALLLCDSYSDISFMFRNRNKF